MAGYSCLSPHTNIVTFPYIREVAAASEQRLRIHMYVTFENPRNLFPHVFGLNAPATEMLRCRCVPTLAASMTIRVSRRPHPTPTT